MWLLPKEQLSPSIAMDDAESTTVNHASVEADDYHDEEYVDK
jgi:hypothetical protein